ncbi:MAG TPA: hypothetical protein VFL47_13755, partial [Flavisolibacter sp.]|nr:hypothetical protein [Flavisolibacter sp.]
IFSISRGLLVIEEHGGGKQQLRFKVWPRPSKTVTFSFVVLSVIVALAAHNQATAVAIILGLIAFAILAEYIKDTASTLQDLKQAFESLDYRCMQQTSVREHSEVFEPLELLYPAMEKILEEKHPLASASTPNHSTRRRAFQKLPSIPGYFRKNLNISNR